MLRLPGQGDGTPPLVTPPRPDETAAPEEFEEPAEGAFPPEPSGGDFKFILALVVPSLLLLGAFGWWMMREPADSPSPVTALPVPAEPLPASGEPKAAPPVKSMMLEIEEVVKAFLDAPTPAELLRHVRDPEQTAPRLEAWLAGKPYAAPGFREIIDDSANFVEEDGSMVTVQVRTGDFGVREIVLLGKAGSLKVDWESWAGWSEMSWEEFQAKRPTEPKWFRVTLSRVDYYNFSFKDEKEWVSYRLDSPDDSASLYGYVPTASQLDERIRPIEAGGEVKLLLRLKYPPGALSGNQVLIDSVSGREWVELPGQENR